MYTLQSPSPCPAILPGLEMHEHLSQVLNFPKAGNWTQVNF